MTFDVIQYWENRYHAGGNSGQGSYGELAQIKADTLNAFVKEHNIQSVIDFGCGDGNQLLLAEYPRYIGLDVSPTVIQTCKDLFVDDETKRFSIYNPEKFEIEKMGIGKVDLTLSIDVIFHLVDDSLFEAHMRHLFEMADRYVIIYSSNVTHCAFFGPNVKPAVHVKHRCFMDWINVHAPNWHLDKAMASQCPDKTFSSFFIYRKGE